MKIGTELDARSRRNKLIEVTGRWTERWRKATGRSDQEARQTAGVSSSDRTLSTENDQTHQWHYSSSSATFNTDRTLVANRPNAGQHRLIEYREVPEWQNCDWTCPVACDRTLAASDQLIAALTVGTTGCVRSGRDQRPISSRKAGFRPQRLLSWWGL